MIKAIIFDIGGVMFDESLSPNYKDIAESLNIKHKRFLPVKDTYLNMAKIGKLNGREFIRKIADELNIDFNMLYQKWTERYREKIINQDMTNLVKRLKRNKYKTVVLSNTNELHAQINYKRGLYSNFDHVFLSNELKIAKPDKKIYRYVLKNLKLKPGECIFIDDKEDNVNVAKKLGIKSIVFEDYNTLIKKLEESRVKL